MALELEEPFIRYPNDLPLNNYQAQFNEALISSLYAGFHPDSWGDTNGNGGTFQTRNHDGNVNSSSSSSNSSSFLPPKTNSLDSSGENNSTAFDKGSIPGSSLSSSRSILKRTSLLDESGVKTSVFDNQGSIRTSTSNDNDSSQNKPKNSGLSTMVQFSIPEGSGAF